MQTRYFIEIGVFFALAVVFQVMIGTFVDNFRFLHKEILKLE